MSRMSLTALVKSVAGGGAAAKKAARTVRLQWTPDDSAGPVTVSAELDEHEAWGLFVLAEQELPVKAMVTVEDDGSSYRTQVIGRREMRDGWELELAFIGAGRRREPRTPVCGPAQIEISGEGAAKRAAYHQAEVTDVSSGGMRLHTPEPVKAGVSLRIHGEEDQYFGVARYCFKRDDGFDVGVQFFHRNSLPGE